MTDDTIIFYENHYRKAPVTQDFNFFKANTVVIVSHVCIHAAYIHVCVCLYINKKRNSIYSNFMCIQVCISIHLPKTDFPELEHCYIKQVY